MSKPARGAALFAFRVAEPREHHTGRECVAQLVGHHQDGITGCALVDSLGGAVVLETAIDWRAPSTRATSGGAPRCWK